MWVRGFLVRGVPVTKEMNEWSDNEFRLFHRMEMPAEAEADRYVQILYDAVLFSPDEDYTFREAAREALKQRLWFDYGVVFDETFDWAEYKRNGESGG